QHIGTLGQAQAGLATRVGLQVEHDRALVAVQMQIQGAHARIAHGPHRAHVVPRRGLDLDHVGTQVTEDLRGIRPHDNRTQIENADARQRAALPCCRRFSHDASGYCGSRLASRIHLPQSSYCSATNAAKSSGVPLNASKPSSARRALVSGLLTILLMAAFSVLTISGSMPAGPK